MFKFKLNVLALYILNWWQGKGLIVLAALGAFIAPVKGLIAGVGLLVITDMVTGILAAKKSKKEIQSRKMFRTVAKFVVYGLFVLVAHWVQIEFIPEWPATKLVGALIAAIELKSLDENAKILFGVSFFDKIIDILSKKRKEDK